MPRPTLLNPVRFGREVIDQFGRYLMTTFPIADTELEEQVRQRVQHGLGGEGLIAKGPYVTLNKPFEPGPRLEDLARDPALALHGALPSLFPFESVHAHQDAALRAVLQGRHVVLATGTGSGKTEAFLLPIIDHCLKLRDQSAASGVAAVLVYPMNALADDQLRRLRPLLAGTQVTYGRYTGVTPESGGPSAQLRESRRYTPAELRQFERGDADNLPTPWEECWSRESIRERQPRILLTNYSQLEYLLLRDKDLDLFRGAPLRFLVLDEVHTYTGALGSEVACLVRRLRHVAGKSAATLTCIGTSATVQDTGGPIDARQVTTHFARRLFGVPGDDITVVTERYRRANPPGPDHYLPPTPEAPIALLDEVLAEARSLQLQDVVSDLSPTLLALTEKLCGHPAPAGRTALTRAHDLLARSRFVDALEDVFRSPALVSEAFPRLRALGRKASTDDALLAEILAYLTIGSLVHADGEPLLRPKLHYFVQGYQGLGICFDDRGRPRVQFDAQPGDVIDGAKVFELVLCRSCGQHYVTLRVADEQADPQGGPGFIQTEAPSRFAESDGDTKKLYVTDRLVGIDEDESNVVEALELCRHCGSISDEGAGRCLNIACARPDGLVKVRAHRGELKQCLACGTHAKGYEEIVTRAMSSEVADVTILAQVMLSAMPEPKLRKLLIFSDNRQDAAFQAGWMEERSVRFRLRHLLCKTLAADPERTFSLADLTDDMLEAAHREGIYRESAWSSENNRKRIRWFLLEEFASTGQRRSSIESLALGEVRWKGMASEEAAPFYQRWTGRLALSSDELHSVLRLLADYYRRRGMLSDEFLRRVWSGGDPEILRRLVRVPDSWRPHGLMRESVARAKWGRGWVAGNGRAAAQVLVLAALGSEREIDADARDEFLSDVWSWWTSSRVLVPVTLLRRRAGRHEPIPDQGRLFHLDVERVGIRATSSRWTCRACRRSQLVSTPSGRCPEYGCAGVLAKEPRPEDHFDVVQYTRGEFAPLLAREHSAQVPKEERQEIEQEFKKDTGGRYNCLVCTPTLELGVDIGKLEMVVMRNVPPSPANYAQRAGRAGRRHRIAAVVTYCRGSSHDRYFFAQPEAMIAGEIRVPAFSMRNEPLIRKHVHSAVLTTLRELATDVDRATLSEVFPDFIRSSLIERDDEDVKGRTRYLPEPRDVSGLGDVIARHRDDVQADVRSAFQGAWPPEDESAVSDDVLDQLIDEMPARLARHVRGLFAQVTAWRTELRKLRDVEDSGGQLSDDERAERLRYEHAVRELLRPTRQENYSLSFLSLDGFFPGYAMARDSVRAQCTEPFLEISRPATVGLRELTPSNFIYANRNVFRVRRIQLHAPASEDGRSAAVVHLRRMLWSPDPARIEDLATRTTEGGRSPGTVEVGSFRLTSVEMFRKQDIDDHERQRRRVGFVVQGAALESHGGGRHGQLGRFEVKFFQQQHLRIVNLGEPARGEGLPFLGFPVCGACGESRSPRASEAEIEEFSADHLKRHGLAMVARHALHVDLVSDALHVGPFPELADAENVFEGLRVGARLVLDMGGSEVEGFTMADSAGRFRVVAHDPMPGGSGFLPQLLEFWQLTCERAVDALQRCASKCTMSCYSCMQHFRNQHAHALLNRHAAIVLLQELAQPLDVSHSIPRVVRQPDDVTDRADSRAELDLAAACRERGFPAPPVPQHRVGLGNGDSTVADWAWPDKKVLVFVDGMSEHIHGNPEQRRLDRVRRAKARMQGWRIVEITAEALRDRTSLAVHLDELAVYLE